MTEPYAGYHGLDFVEEFGPSAFIMRARAEGMRDFGACLSPQNAFYLIQGLETLSIRMKSHVENALAIAEFLMDAKEVSWVRYPDLEGHPDKDLAKKLLPKGSGSIVTFGIKAGPGGARKSGAIFIESLEVFSHLANVGDAKSLVIHPASTTHQQMDKEELKAAGVGEEMIRVSVGLEDTADLVSDLRQALRLSQK
jgi:O-acetylhomoserine (thiol)-lyase